MIRSLKLENFQIHEHLFIDFAANVNVIIGSSDTGKSAIIRALRWITENRPLGDGFKRHGAPFVSASIVLGDGTEITRRSGKSGNLYQLQGPNDPDPEIFEGFNTNVPPEIRNALNLSDVNIQNQMDSAFLLSESSAQVSRSLNEAADLSVIDRSNSRIIARLRSLQKELPTAELELTQLEDEAKEFEWVTEASTLLETINEKQKELTEKETQSQNLKGILNSLSESEIIIKEASRLKEAEEFVNEIESNLALLKIKEEKRNKLNGCLTSIHSNKNQIEYLTGSLDEKESEFKSTFPESCPLCGTVSPLGKRRRR